MSRRPHRRCRRVRLEARLRLGLSRSCSATGAGCGADRSGCAGTAGGGPRSPMITVPAGVRVYLALGATDMRKGFDGLSLLAQEVLREEPCSVMRWFSMSVRPEGTSRGCHGDTEEPHRSVSHPSGAAAVEPEGRLRVAHNPTGPTTTTEAVNPSGI